MAHTGDHSTQGTESGGSRTLGKLGLLSEVILKKIRVSECGRSLVVRAYPACIKLGFQFSVLQNTQIILIKQSNKTTNLRTKTIKL